MKHTRPSQPLICSRPPCSTPPRCPIVKCQPYQYLHLDTQASLQRLASAARSHLAQVLARFNTRLIFMYVSSYFTMVPPCLVSSASAYCPARLLSPPSLRSLHLFFPLLLPLTWFLTVTSCLARLFRWLLSMFYPNFLPSVASLGIVCGSPLLATLCPFFSSSSCSTPPLCSFPFLL